MQMMAARLSDEEIAALAAYFSDSGLTGNTLGGEHMKLNRRVFIGSGAAAATTLTAPMAFAGGHGKPRVVVVGGGAGGATAARYIAKDSKGRG